MLSRANGHPSRRSEVKAERPMSNIQRSKENQESRKRGRNFKRRNASWKAEIGGRDESRGAGKHRPMKSSEVLLPAARSIGTMKDCESLARLSRPCHSADGRASRSYSRASRNGRFGIGYRGNLARSDSGNRIADRSNSGIALPILFRDTRGRQVALRCGKVRDR